MVQPRQEAVRTSICVFVNNTNTSVARIPRQSGTSGLAALGGLTYTSRMSDSQAIGERIRLARQERGLTQEQLAEAVGVTRSAVAQWETGRAGQVTGNLSRIAAVLAVGVEYLMFGDDKVAPQRATRGDELAILRLYRDCTPADQQLLLRTARRLAAR